MIEWIIHDFLTSLVPWLIGIAIGSPLGYGCAVLVRRLYSVRPNLRGILMVLPWRTLIMTPLVLHPFLPQYFGIGDPMGEIIVLFLAFFFGLALTALTTLHDWYPLARAIRLLGGARTLAIVSVTLTIAVSQLAGGSYLGGVLYQGIARRDQDQRAAYSALWGSAILIVVVDLTLGLAQLILYERSIKSKTN